MQGGWSLGADLGNRCWLFVEDRRHRLGDYEIQSMLGAGGMGEVYRARDLRLRREVAIKVLPSFASSDPERLRRFQS